MAIALWDSWMKRSDRSFGYLGEKGDRALGKRNNYATLKALGDCFEVLRYRLQIYVIVGSQYFE